MAITNNVTRFLESRGIQFIALELPPEKLGALEAAQHLGVNPAHVFKTIVVMREKPKRPLLVLVPGGSTVDLKLVAKALGDKKVYLPTEREAEAITGLRAGGISPLALRHKGFTVIVDESARQLEQMHISGGQRGLNIRLRVQDLMAVTDAAFAVVARME